MTSDELVCVADGWLRSAGTPGCGDARDTPVEHEQDVALRDGVCSSIKGVHRGIADSGCCSSLVAGVGQGEDPGHFECEALEFSLTGGMVDEVVVKPSGGTHECTRGCQGGVLGQEGELVSREGGKVRVIDDHELSATLDCTNDDTHGVAGDKEWDVIGINTSSRGGPKVDDHERCGGGSAVGSPAIAVGVHTIHSLEDDRCGRGDAGTRWHVGYDGNRDVCSAVYAIGKGGCFEDMRGDADVADLGQATVKGCLKADVDNAEADVVLASFWECCQTWFLCSCRLQGM